jgi:hypothetical protein
MSQPITKLLLTGPPGCGMQAGVEVTLQAHKRSGTKAGRCQSPDL